MTCSHQMGKQFRKLHSIPRNACILLSSGQHLNTIPLPRIGLCGQNASCRYKTGITWDHGPWRKKTTIKGAQPLWHNQATHCSCITWTNPGHATLLSIRDRQREPYCSEQWDFLWQPDFPTTVFRFHCQISHRWINSALSYPRQWPQNSTLLTPHHHCHVGHTNESCLR